MRFISFLKKGFKMGLGEVKWKSGFPTKLGNKLFNIS